LVLDSENGYVFDTAEQGAELLEKMLRDTEKTRAMGRKSREIAETHYSLEKMGEGYRNIYSALIDGRELIPCR
jgi:glycosyltransferase involved in cell wall biosynthesis